MTETIESRLNFVINESMAASGAVLLKGAQSESYYQSALTKYCEENKIDLSEDNCSAMIMTDYGSEAITDDMNEQFWFWIDA